MLKPAVRPVHELLTTWRPEDLILFNLSIHDDFYEAIENLACRKGLYYHGITPPKYFRAYDAEFATLCEKAYDHLKRAAAFDKIAANSAYTARDLHNFVRENAPIDDRSEAEVLDCVSPERAQATLLRALEAIETVLTGSGRPCGSGAVPYEDLVQEGKLTHDIDSFAFPPILSPRSWDTIEPEDVRMPSTGTLLLYVGRIAPHKRIEDLIALYAAYIELDPDSHLTIVGNPQFRDYVKYLEYFRQTTCKDARITFLENLSRGRLKTVYTRSSAYVTMSEHEGFCVPLVEAMCFGKPVFAYAHPAIRETLGESGRVFFKKDFEAIAKDMHRVLNSEEELDRMVARQYRRLSEISEEADGRAIWRFFEDLVFCDEKGS